MNFKWKMLLAACLIVLTLLCVSGCSGEATPYEINDQDNYNVSIRYDANGGQFTTNTSIIMDTFNISVMSTNSAGDVEIPLLAPSDAQRGNDAYEAKNPGYFLAGWYQKRIESTDADGNTVYTYSDKWDFTTDTVKLDAADSYSAAEPVMTLYAAWVPMYEIKFINMDDGKECGTYQFNPKDAEEIFVPQWDEETGLLEMFDFPERDGYTFESVYYDAHASVPVEGDTVIHTGEIDEKTGTAKNHSMNLYVKWTAGEWYRIYTAEQFIDNASVAGNYIIMADLDFAGMNWPTNLMHGNFKGSIQGNGFTFKNITAIQKDMSKVTSGLFGNLTEGATIDSVNFDNVKFIIQGGTRKSDASFGLLAGIISSGENAPVLNDVVITNSFLQIDSGTPTNPMSGAAFTAEGYSIGLIAGLGSSEEIKFENIQCQVIGEQPDKYSVHVDGTSVTLVLKDGQTDSGTSDELEGAGPGIGGNQPGDPVEKPPVVE